MDFFEQQDKARSNTKLLVFLFLCAVVTLIAITNVVVAFSLALLDSQTSTSYQHTLDTMSYAGDSYFNWNRFTLITAAVTGAIIIAMLFKWLQLSAGGKRIAETLGGKRVNPNTDDATENRLLNVVEEMAIASGMPVPAVYLLDKERGINAFAAGNTPADAVIGVTRGCITQLDRRQLQGVIAHEFSHILNGDMRLNIRLIAVLYGILFVGDFGEMLWRSGSRRRRYSRRSNDDGRIALLGLGLVIIGWLGSLFGNMIKSAVSRQREFLADASAVQFTRNPDGIRDALRVIGGDQFGTEVDDPNAGEIRHLFFGQALSRLGSLFATHPPLEDRIARIDPQWNGKFIVKPRQPETPTSQQTSHKIPEEQRREAALAITAAAAGIHLGDDDNTALVSHQVDGIPASLVAQANDPLGANALLYALLLSTATSLRIKQMVSIENNQVPGLVKQVEDIAADLHTLNKRCRLPLVELALPALKCMSAAQYKQFIRTLMLLIRADKSVELFEWCLYQLVRHYLDADFNKAKPSQTKYKKVNQVAAEYQLVASMLAHHGHHNDDDTQRAYHRAANTAGLYTHPLLSLEQCNLDAFTRSVTKLADCYPLLKSRLIKGLANCAFHDDNIVPIEKDILTTLSAIMDCPAPALN